MTTTDAAALARELPDGAKRALIAYVRKDGGPMFATALGDQDVEDLWFFSMLLAMAKQDRLVTRKRESMGGFLYTPTPLGLAVKAHLEAEQGAGE